MTEMTTRPATSVGVSEYHVRRSEAYRQMKSKLHGQVAELQAQIAELKREREDLRGGIAADLDLHDLAHHPVFQRVRDAHAAQRAVIAELRAELRRVNPNGRAVYTTPEYRKLRAEHAALHDEARELRRLRWAEQAHDDIRARTQWMSEVLRHLVSGEELSPEGFTRWHLREAMVWADTASIPLSGLIASLQHVRREGQDPHMTYRQRHGYVPAALRRRLLHAYAMCAECGAEKDLSIDHIVPLARGGRSGAENLQVLCRSCNSRKGVRLEAEMARLAATDGESLAGADAREPGPEVEDEFLERTAGGA